MCIGRHFHKSPHISHILHLLIDVYGDGNRLPEIFRL